MITKTESFSFLNLDFVVDRFDGDIRYAMSEILKQAVPFFIKRGKTSVANGLCLPDQIFMKGFGNAVGKAPIGANVFFEQICLI